MAAYAISVYKVEDADYNVVVAGMEAHLETLDSTTAPIVLAQIMISPKSGNFIGIVLAD